MSLDRFKPAWQQFKLNHSLDGMSQEDILALIAEKPGINRHRSLMVNLMMLLAFLMVCY